MRTSLKTIEYALHTSFKEAMFVEKFPQTDARRL